MAGSPQWKIFEGSEYVASAKYLILAAQIATLLADGKIKLDGKIVWSYDGSGYRTRNYEIVAAQVREKLTSA